MKVTLDANELDEAISDWVEKHHPDLVVTDKSDYEWADTDGDEVDAPGEVTVPVTKRLPPEGGKAAAKA